jgi:lipopolysaccharide transport protein LptA
MRKYTFGACLLSSVVFANLFAAPVEAQVSFGNDSPIHVKAEQATYKGSKTTLSGNVRVKQKDATILADRMDLHRAKAEIVEAVEGSIKLGNINRIVAIGNFKYITSENHVTGDKGVYERDKEIITVTGNARFIQNNGNTVTGNKMIYDLNTNRARVDGSCAGRDCKNNDRVELNIGGKE